MGIDAQPITAPEEPRREANGRKPTRRNERRCIPLRLTSHCRSDMSHFVKISLIGKFLNALLTSLSFRPGAPQQLRQPALGEMPKNYVIRKVELRWWPIPRRGESSEYGLLPTST